MHRRDTESIWIPLVENMDTGQDAFRNFVRRLCNIYIYQFIRRTRPLPLGDVIVVRLEALIFAVTAL
jgi:hypothetical protein